ncbi:MAG: hypothetical protein K2W96_19990 [Gemmataceae bacterium]|nr:hypothetical protein [Gemmataceae bacterium]
MGLASPIRAEGETFHLFEFGVRAAEPLELLMAIRPRGVICYFSALSFHSLTTQAVAHHHVAELHESRPMAARKEAVPKVASQEQPVPRFSPPSLGTLLYTHEGVPHYVTKRSSRLIPGIQTRAWGPRTNLRITTREQSLLDALAKPFHSGGPEVVFEAWREGISGRLDEERLAGYIGSMDYPSTARRAGAMMKLLGHIPGKGLARRLEQIRAGMDRAAPHARISLLPGMGYAALDDEWLVSIP